MPTVRSVKYITPLVEHEVKQKMPNFNFDDEEDEAPPPSEAVLPWVEDEWEDRFERDRGMLTDTDRQFLWGVKTYDSKVTRSERRRAIRERVEHTLLDLFYLTMLDDDQRERVFEAIEGGQEPGELRSAVASLVEFLYLGLDGDVEWFEETLSHGIHNAERELQDNEKTFYAGASVDAGVDVDIEVTRGYDVGEIEARLRSGRGNTLTPAEVGVLVREGRVDEEDIWDLSHGGAGTPPTEAASPNDEGMPINPMMPDRKWFAEDEDIDDLNLAGLWSDEAEDDEE